jgi:hypothetical protein
MNARYRIAITDPAGATSRISRTTSSLEELGELANEVWELARQGYAVQVEILAAPAALELIGAAAR